MRTTPKAQQVARVLPIAADPLALPLQVVAVLALFIFGVLESAAPRAVFMVLVGLLAAFALAVGTGVRHQPRVNWGVGAMWIVLGTVLTADAALMFYALVR